MPDSLWTDEEWRAAMSTADINDLPDEDFAFIEPGGKKDDEGKTIPRRLRHYPVQDAAHARNPLARAGAAIAGDYAEAKAPAEKALPKIKAAAKKFGIDAGEQKSASDPTEWRHAAFSGTHSHPHSAFGSQGDDDEHSHEHSHDGDAEHDHAHGRSASIVPRRVRKPRHRAAPAVGTEYRVFSAGIEMRAAEGGPDYLIELRGTPIVYGTPYQVRDIFGVFEETMAPGVASDILPTADTRFLFNHGGLPLARTPNTLTLRDTPRGLSFTTQVDIRQSVANDLVIAIERGDVSQMSCGFTVAPGGDEWRDDEHRQVNKFASLTDISAVTYPCSTTTDIEVAHRMLQAAPVESRARIRRMWSVAANLRNGPVAQEQYEALTSGLRALAEADGEARAEPTEQDSIVSAKLTAAHKAMHDLVQAQAADPDNGTDPDDEEVWRHIKNAQASLLQASKAQSADAAPEPESGEEADGTAGDEESEAQMGDDGTRSGATESEQRDSSRLTTANLAMELELMRLRQRRRQAA